MYAVEGHDAATVRRSIERGIATGALRPGDRLPSVRGLARSLGLSPSTIATAYRDLRQRGLVVSHDRARTVVAPHREVTTRLRPTLPPGGRDLGSGNPDPALLPDPAPHLRRLRPPTVRYGTGSDDTRLRALAGQAFTADGVEASHLAVVASGLDGIERILAVHCRPGDRVAVEDPGYLGSLDLLRTIGLEPVPVAVDADGPQVDALADALASGVAALLVVPRAQNPTGAVLGPDRAAALRAVLDDHPEVVVIEDDPLAPLAEAPLATLTTGRSRWAAVRSLAKSLGPDLRLAVVAGDATTLSALRARQRLGPGWVSHLLQDLGAAIWQAAVDDGTLDRAAAAYAARRGALVTALASLGLEVRASSGLNLWVPVPEEATVVQGLAARGWLVEAGELFRIASEPAIRITIAELLPDEAPLLAADLAAVLGRDLPARRG